MIYIPVVLCDFVQRARSRDQISFRSSTLTLNRDFYGKFCIWYTLFMNVKVVELSFLEVLMLSDDVYTT